MHLRCVLLLLLLHLLGFDLVRAQFNYPQNFQNPSNNNNGEDLQNVQDLNNRYPNDLQNFDGQNPNNNPQMQSHYYQNQYQNGQQYQRPDGFVNTAPFTNTFPNGPNQTGAVIRLQLTSYSNPHLRLPGDTTCMCPSQAPHACSYLFTTGPQCYFSFTTMVSAPDTSVQYIATEFMPLDYNGNIDLVHSTANWSVTQAIYLSSKPTAIDIFVHHLGVVIDQSTANLKLFNDLVHVDTFVQSLKDVLPQISSQAPTTKPATLTGQILQTTLTMSYSVQCLNDFIGPNCDMTCKPSPANPQNAVCYSNVTGFYSICTYQNDQQVSNCQPCQNGVSNGQCLGNTINIAMNDDGYVAFRSWTIVIGCLLGLAIIFIILLIIFIIFMFKKRTDSGYRAPPPPTNTWSEPGAARHPLVGDPYPSNVDQNSQDWGYQPHVISVNNQRSAPIADHEARHHSQSSDDDDQDLHRSYSNSRPSTGNSVTLARREAQV